MVRAGLQRGWQGQLGRADLCLEGLCGTTWERALRVTNINPSILMRSTAMAGVEADWSVLTNHSPKPTSGKSNIHVLRHGIKGQLDRNKSVQVGNEAGRGALCLKQR